MDDLLTDPPSPDEIELSMWGPGYGEAIAIHTGSGFWTIVDSCLDPDSGDPAALRYLDGLGVDVAKSVKLVVATHWHDDHIRGIGTLYQKCSSAKLWISGALRSDEFLRLLDIYQRSITVGSSGLDEFGKLMRLSMARSIGSEKYGRSAFGGIGLASANKVLIDQRLLVGSQPVAVRLAALSPSDATELRAAMSFSSLIGRPGQQKRRIVSPTKNDVAVVLWLQIGNSHILLGSDLENDSDPSAGWIAVLDDCTVMRGQASVFKIAHHGSENSHEDRVWSELLAQEPVGILSPYQRGDVDLPKDEDVRRIRKMTPRGYITSNRRRQSYKFKQPRVRELVNASARSVYKVDSGWGQIRLRRGMVDVDAEWKVDLFGDAQALTSWRKSSAM